MLIGRKALRLACYIFYKIFASVYPVLAPRRVLPASTPEIGLGRILKPVAEAETSKTQRSPGLYNFYRVFVILDRDVAGPFKKLEQRGGYCSYKT